MQFKNERKMSCVTLTTQFSAYIRNYEKKNQVDFIFPKMTCNFNYSLRFSFVVLLKSDENMIYSDTLRCTQNRKQLKLFLGGPFLYEALIKILYTHHRADVP